MRVLVLSGGGSHGAWQAGAIKALAEKYHYDAVVGSSVGAVNAVGLSCVGAIGLERLWASIGGTGGVMKFNWQWPWQWEGVFTFSPLRTLLQKELVLSKPSTPVYICTTNLETGELCHDLVTENVEATVDLLLGSCALAGIQAPTNNRIDGGHRDQVPIAYAINELRATEVHVVVADPVQQSMGTWARWSFFPILSIMLRALGCMINEIFRSDLDRYKDRVKVFAPKMPLPYSSLEYNSADIQEAFEEGYQETRDALSMA